MIYEVFIMWPQNCLETSRLYKYCVLNVNTCCTYVISTCYDVCELPKYFLCNLCNIFCFSGFTDQACEPIKIMFVIPITIDFAHGAN